MQSCGLIQWREFLFLLKINLNERAINFVRFFSSFWGIFNLVFGGGQIRWEMKSKGLTDQRTGCLICFPNAGHRELTFTLTGRKIFGLTNWLTNWLTDWLADWLTEFTAVAVAVEWATIVTTAAVKLNDSRWCLVRLYWNRTTDKLFSFFRLLQIKPFETR